MPVFNIIICALLLGVFLVFFLPIGIKINRSAASLALITAVAGFLVVATGIAGILYLTLAAFCLWAFMFGFLVNRKYPYILAIGFLVVCPFLLVAKLDSLAEFFAVLAYLCLVLGVVKDIFYDQLIDGGGND